MVDSKTFWDKMAPKYAESQMRSVEDYEHTLARTLSHLTPEMRVLEMGCGTGTTALRLAPHVKAFVGTDQSSEMIRIARDKAADEHSNLEFRVLGAAESAQLEEGFDVVMGFNLFHLVPDADAVLADIFKMLKPGGLMISKTPCLMDKAFGWKRFLVAGMLPILKRIGKAPDVGLWRIADVDRRIADAGFETLESGNFPAISRYVVARKI
ncbi:MULTISPECIES: class I SAM-dependent methyltransferase [Lentibacter]|jgi:2-polyprenyl-3-methyl-5-hydroxy-6-metoxy-1,4-benzoquinol methylase|uniref:Methyltransferase domain-containing protein n=2 Tax=Lentibacter algarum TaxID=576131 RepID=A0A1H3M785_9RHOB|nr:class I SAM-dependent methyltransferase [Lentibacter algarum]WIF32947.1 methyltransferase domain-containing protein [Lentibacter algarum]SDY72118.1 Methyltransferase domain-containing protein [Lentibacter algarum]